LARKKPFPGVWALSGAGHEDIPCPVPGTVAEALSQAGVNDPETVPGAESASRFDPSARVAESRLSWAGRYSWVLTTELTLEDCPAERHYLEIEGLFGFGALFVDGTKVTLFDHTGGEQPAGENLRAEITGHIAAGQEKLTVSICFTARQLNAGPDTALPGIRGGVWLHSVNRLLISRFCARSGEGHPTMTATGRATVFEPGKYTFCYALAYGNKTLGERLFEQELNREHTDFAHTLHIADAANWTPGADNALYHIKLTVLWGSLGCDLIHKKTGLIRIGSQRVWPKFPPCLWAVNRKPVQLRGTTWAAPAWHPCRMDWVRDQLTALLGAGIQCLYVPAQQEDVFYDLCDSMGMLVWQGLPADETGARAAVLRLMHRPCVAQWALPAEGLKTVRAEEAAQISLADTVAEILTALGDDRPFVGVTPGEPIPYPEWKDLGQRQCYNVEGPVSYIGPEVMPRYANDDDALFRITRFVALCAPEKLRDASGEPLPWPREGRAKPEHSESPIQYELPGAAQWFGHGTADTPGRTSLLSRYLQAEALRYLAERARNRSAVGFFSGSAGRTSFEYASDAILEADGTRRPAYYALRDAYMPVRPCLIMDRTAYWVGTRLDVGVHLLVSPEAAEPATKRTVTAALYNQSGSVLAEDIWTVSCQTGQAGRMSAALPDEPCAVLLRLEVYRDGELQARNDTVFCVGMHALQEALAQTTETTLTLNGESLTNTGGVLALGVSCGCYSRRELPAWGALLPGESLTVCADAEIESLNARLVRVPGIPQAPHHAASPSAEPGEGR